jgi:hypothetical protein
MVCPRYCHVVVIAAQRSGADRVAIMWFHAVVCYVDYICSNLAIFHQSLLSSVGLERLTVIVDCHQKVLCSTQREEIFFCSRVEAFFCCCGNLAMLCFALRI